MPITRSAKKALRVSARKKSVNDRRKKALRAAIKKFEKSVKDGSKSKELLSSAYKAIDKATKGEILNKNTAARKKSRLARLVR